MHLRYLYQAVSISSETQYWGNVHLPLCPLYFLYNIQTAVDDELVHMPCLLWKSCNAISSLFGRSKLIFEERIILSANNGKVIRHCGSLVEVWLYYLFLGGERAVWGGSERWQNGPWLADAIECLGADKSQATFPTPASPPQASTTMFGAFRPTNPLSGGLLWYVKPQYP